MAVKDVDFKGVAWRISYILVNNQAAKNIVFLHGWGSNKELMKLAFGETFKDFNHIYVDLPGFGGSPCEMVLNTYDYAKIIESFLGAMGLQDSIESALNHAGGSGGNNREGQKDSNIIESSLQNPPLDSKDSNISIESNQPLKSNTIIVGHSFGGKIALLLNREIILLSSAGILLPKSLKVRLKIAITKILKTLGIKNFKAFRASDANNLSPVMYEIFKIVVNENFENEYAEFKCKATIFWGENDTATPLQSYHRILELMPKTTRSFILSGDHYFFLKQGEKIEQLYKQS
ncbi:alpha/beta fold hydrolase [Helicobacter saguini]|uniref:Alpha/beta fold hydrolase n=1 Tax=Helicobacter saguini TaxID=1548018 RepID=A0A347VRL8_9HELI|nr:alpha/beta hydrolase [Helicobacter saguini]MWV62854.1 alpha/beta fold hydrolase [Helicobacter saguini]MWV66475.1 alpha/beta fold hydrolase [Helicobacter saguini]MWV68825.1 alpha/beta fold hydrolase [Helicobacter saguini]MWV71620.1 alpha/beta fold hydrolase [Helicobacter saguini]TLD94425.1 alpha/beta hydrolase [Helicobacter saguini]